MQPDRNNNKKVLILYKSKNIKKENDRVTNVQSWGKLESTRLGNRSSDIEIPEFILNFKDKFGG